MYNQIGNNIRYDISISLIPDAIFFFVFFFFYLGISEYEYTVEVFYLYSPLQM